MTSVRTGLMLEGTGMRTADRWPDLVTALPGLTAAWADLDGFHMDAPPIDLPITTHMWCWREDLWVRLRVDGARWVGAVLHGGRATLLNGLRAHQHKDGLTADVTTLIPWSPQDRIGPQRNPAVLRSMDQLVPRLPRTAAFIGEPSTAPRRPR